MTGSRCDRLRRPTPWALHGDWSVISTIGSRSCRAKPGADGSIPDVPGQWVYVDQPRSNGVGGAGQLLPGYEYQQRVTGVPTGLEYRLGGLLFDSVDHGRRILIETKDYAPAWNMPEYIEDKTMEGFVAGVIEQRRVAKANGYTLEIRVSSEAGAERIRMALKEGDVLGVQVVHVAKQSGLTE